MDDPKILVTGATGFIGQVLVQKLASSGMFVRACIRRPLPPKLRIPQVETVCSPDIGRDTDWTPYLRNISHVVHLAAKAHSSDIDARDRWPEYEEINYRGTETLLAACQKQNVRRLIFISSVKVHGEGLERAYCEIDPAAPEDVYAQTKWRAEEAIQNNDVRGATEWVILRPPLVYGPGVKANFLALLRLIDTNLPLPLGALKNRRSLVYVGNLIDAIVRVLNHPKAAGHVFLVSDGQDFSMAEHVEHLARALGHRPKLIPLPVQWLVSLAKLVGREAAIMRLIRPLTVDITKIRRELDWRPPFAVSEGIADTVAWFRQSV